MKNFEELFLEKKDQKNKKPIKKGELKISQIKKGSKFVNHNDYTITIKKIDSKNITYDYKDNISKDTGTETLSLEKFDSLILGN